MYYCNILMRKFIHFWKLYFVKILPQYKGSEAVWLF